MTRRLHWLITSSFLAAAAATAQVPDSAVPTVPATAETEPTTASGADSPAILTDPANPSRSLILGSGKSGGIETYETGGKRIASAPAGNSISIDHRAGLAPGGAGLVVSLDGKSGAPKLFAADRGGKLSPLTLTAPIAQMTPVGLCLAKSYRDGSLYLFMLGEEGGIEQWLLAGTGDGGYVARLARRWALGSEVGYCASDDRGSVYISQEVVGVWRFGVEPEDEITPEIVDIVRLGHITQEAKGVAVAPDGRLVVADSAANRLNLYDPANDYAYLGSVAIGGGAIDAVTDPGGIAIGAGMLVVADDDNTPQATNYKIVPWNKVLAALKLPEQAPPPPPAKIAVVMPTAETQPVETGGDAADDPAIWVDPSDPLRSVIIATQKQSGLYVYGLDGKQIQFLPDGRMNNVDLRTGYRLGGKDIVLVTASNRTTKGISIYALDPVTRMLTNVADGVQPTGLGDPYGLCMYRSAKTGKTHVFVNDTDGKMRQWELVPTPRGKVRAKLLRDLPFKTQVEGCVADDDTGILYVAEEDVGLWREGAEAKGGRPRQMFAAIKDNPALKADMEGISIYRKPDGRGYLVVSSQGNDSYALFRREGDNAYVGSFVIGADGAKGIDGVSETDGLDVTSLAVGPDYPDGLLVVQDGRNVSPPENQNFKLVSWRAIMEALGLRD